MFSGKYHENKWIILLIQVITIFFIVISEVELIFRLMLVFGYFMLFRQKRWHKHLLIMLLMTIILSFTSSGFTFNI